jgi:membrane-associated phospholipid phosphatase
MKRRTLLKGALAVGGSALFPSAALGAVTKARALPEMATNGDEARYGSRLASFSKGLPHDRFGNVDGAAYEAMLRAIRSGRTADYDAIAMGGQLRLVNPQAAQASTREGLAPEATGCAAPPAFSAAQAAEAAELYWMALLRDVPFNEYGDHPLIAAAAADLSRFSAYDAPKEVTPRNLFRGSTKGDLAGPFLSQFLWKEAPYGGIRLVQHVRTATPGLDYLTRHDDWLAMQNGAATTLRHASAYRYIRSLRDLAAYVQLDFTHQAFETACLILFGMQRTTDAQYVYKGAPWDANNPYRGSKTQTGFVTFGVAHALDLVPRVAHHALVASWYHKWLVHRRLRPEEYGGRVQHQMAGTAAYPVHEELLGSSVLARIHDANGSWLLPQAYAEGAPLHPSYPSGHAVIAGACVTVLKAFFDESFPLDDPVIASSDGLSLQPYREEPLTVGGELDKLACNIAFGRNAAGVHWRSDALAGLRLGQEVALAVLRDLRGTWHEDFPGFRLTTFEGQTLTV